MVVSVISGRSLRVRLVEGNPGVTRNRAYKFLVNHMPRM